VLFASPKRNSFFSSLPSVFYFFATHNRHKNSLTETAKTYTGQVMTMTEDRRPACNSGFAKKRVQWLNEALRFVSSSVLAESFVLRNPLLRQAPNRYSQW
jgi:glutaredoxin-related protein